MTPVSFIAGRATVLALAHVDTDRILPARFLLQPGGDALFRDLRAADPACPLRPAGNPPILLAGPNFGCGAAREAAARALLVSGIRCIIAPGFGGFFPDMAARIGLLTIALPPDLFTALLDGVRRDPEVSVDLERERIRCAGFEYPFQLDRFMRDCLLAGLDELTITRDSAIADAIDRFEGADARRRPWATPV